VRVRGAAVARTLGALCALTAGSLGFAHEHLASTREIVAREQDPAAQILEIALRPITIHDGIGLAHDSVSTSSKQAQAFYDQGLAYLHSYVWLEAARSFNQALRLDSKLAMAELGLTIAYTELNAPAAGRSAMERAEALATGVADRESRRIRARKLQMAAELAPADTAKLAAYRAALDGAVSKYPEDEELLLLRGLAESPDPAERGQGSVAASMPFYKKALALAPTHFAAHHFLAHAYENTGATTEALKEAETYARMAPNVPHARHMHGHELRRTGQVERAITEFTAADTLETEYFHKEHVPSEYDWHYRHNLDLLATSYQYVGQMATAEKLLKTAFAIDSKSIEQEINKREWPVFLLSRGRADEALAAANVLAAHPSPLVSATGHLAAGEAYLSLGRFQSAADAANSALRLMRSSPEGAGLVAADLAVLQGEFFVRTGQRDKGRATLEDAVHKLRAAPGPDNWAQALFVLEAIARTGREAGAWDLAGWAAGQMMEHDANYAGSHYAVALAAQHSGDSRQALAEFALAQKLWSKGDVDLAELTAIRVALATPRP
jgi:tetratricopeptide (TPR) repeat protein